MPDMDVQPDNVSETKPQVSPEMEDHPEQQSEKEAILKPSNEHQSDSTDPTVKVVNGVDTNNGENDNSDADVEKTKDENEPKMSGLQFFRSLSGRRKSTLIVIVVCMFMSTAAYSFLGPFFSREASKKDMNLTLVGVVFGVFELVVFLTCPLYGNYMVRLGPKRVFVAGVVVAGVCNVLFGVLEYSPDGPPFIAMSILIRAVEALGVSAYITANVAIVSYEFKENVGLALGIVESVEGLGFMLGPTIGAGLYEAGGFGVPFYCAGGVILFNAVLLYKFLPVVEDVPSKRKGSVFTLLKSPLIIVGICVVVVSIMGIAASNATLAKRLEPLDLSVGLIGVVFGVLAGVYSIMSTAMGYVSDALDIRAPLMIGGLLVYGIGYSLTGPSFILPFIPDDHLAPILVGLALIGGGYGTTLVPTIKSMLIGATELGFENNLDTYALVAGLFNSVQTLGGFVGPIGAGYLIEERGFRTAYGVIGLCSLSVMGILIVFFLLRQFRNKKVRDASEPKEEAAESMI